MTLRRHLLTAPNAFARLVTTLPGGTSPGPITFSLPQGGRQCPDLGVQFQAGGERLVGEVVRRDRLHRVTDQIGVTGTSRIGVTEVAIGPRDGHPKGGTTRSRSCSPIGPLTWRFSTRTTDRLATIERQRYGKRRSSERSPDMTLRTWLNASVTEPPSSHSDVVLRPSVAATRGIADDVQRTGCSGGGYQMSGWTTLRACRCVRLISPPQVMMSRWGSS
jgi:hypothetical protein